MGFWRGRGKEPPGEAGTGSAAAGGPASLFPDRWICAPAPAGVSLYRAIREAVPVVDAAVLKLVRWPAAWG